MKTLSQHTRKAGGLPDNSRRSRFRKRMQLVYACLPPVMVLAMEQHLRAQTRIEQRAQELWFAGGGGNALADWLRAESEVVQNLCYALLHGGHLS